MRRHALRSLTDDAGLLALSRSNLALSTPVASYYLDPSNSTGNATDSGPGSAAKPFLTTAPLLLLTGWTSLTALVGIFVLSDFPPGAPTWFLNFSAGVGGQLWIHGTQVIVRSGTLSASTDVVPSTNTLMTVTDFAGFDFTPWIGKAFIKITSGPDAGLIAGIRNVSGGAAVLFALGDDSPFTIDVAPIAHLATPVSYELVRPTKLPNVQWTANGPYTGLSSANEGQLVVTDCAFKDDPNNTSSFLGSGQIQFADCLLGSSSWNVPFGVVTWVNCIETAGSTHFIDGDIIAVGGGAVGVLLNVETGGRFQEDDWGMENGSNLAIDAGGVANLLTCDAFNCDSPFVVQGILRFFLAGHILWGSGNTTTTIALSNTGVFENGIGSGNSITITNVSGIDFTCDGQTSTSAWQKQDGSYNAGAVTNTFGHLAATNGAGGFQNYVSSPTTGSTRIVPSTTV